MSDTVVEFVNVSKRYFIGEHSIRTLRDDVGRFFRRFIAANSHNDDKKELWGLKDVSFNIKRGESVGIIGPNGSGKTTIFKLISRITSPTRGKVTVNGRVGSIIDLNAGFHPELAGVENIYLNATIRGMKRSQIKKNVDEILSFAELAKFKDTPIKHYSSGMRVRLGFSVAVFCPFDVLLIDEVLAVGDISFQRKCFEKIDSLKKEGKTILFISQDADKVVSVTMRTLCVSRGRIIADADSLTAVNAYINLHL